MRKIIIYSLLGFATAAFSYKSSQIVTLDDIVKSEIFNDMENMTEDQAESFLFENWDSNNVIKLEEGSIVPVDIFINGDYFLLINNFSNQKKNSVAIALKKDLYMQINKGQFFFSKDLTSWDEASTFFTGNINLALKKTKDNAPQITIDANINQR